MQKLAAAAALLVFGPALVAQDLAAAAQKEKERREKAGKKAQSFSNEDIEKDKPKPSASPSPGGNPAPSNGAPMSERDRRLRGLGGSGSAPPPSASGGASGSAPAAGASEAVGSSEESSAQPQANKASEEYWRERSKGLHEALENAEKSVTRIQSQLDNVREGQTQPMPIDAMAQIPPNPAISSARGDDLRAQLEQAKADVEKAKKALEGLDEEVRKAGVPPGWIR
jgi:hypothetical protein